MLAAIHAQETVPWHRQAWSTWPAAVQVVALFLLASLFAGLCLGAYELPELAAVAALKHRLLTCLSVLNATWGAVMAVINAAFQLVQNWSTGLLVGCLVAAILGYLMCVGLGTVYVRLAMSRR